LLNGEREPRTEIDALDPLRVAIFVVDAFCAGQFAAQVLGHDVLAERNASRPTPALTPSATLAPASCYKFTGSIR
jgi:hypothetical protein